MKINPGLPFYGINVDKALELLNADKFLGEFCVQGMYQPVAMYYSENPDKSKGHKQFPFIFVDPASNQTFIGALDKEEFEQYRYQNAVLCKKCDEVIYSKNRHDFHECSCRSVNVDGGRDYFKVGYYPDSIYEYVTIDFFTGEIIMPKLTFWKKLIKRVLNR